MHSGACGAFVHGLEDEMMGEESKFLLHEHLGVTRAAGCGKQHRCLQRKNQAV